MAKSKPKHSKQNPSNAAEYYFAAYLSAKDFTVTITLGRNEKYDLLAVNPKTGKASKISVKSRFEDAKTFVLSEKDERPKVPNLYYALINLRKLEELPDFWLIPSVIVVRHIKKEHRAWLKVRGRNGKKHEENAIRKFHVNDKWGAEEWKQTVEKYHNSIKALK